MINKLAALIFKGRLIVLALMAILTVFFGYKALDLSLKQDLNDILPPHHPYTQVDKKFFEIFGGSNLVAIGMKVKTGEITDYQNLAKIFGITEGLDTIPDSVNYRIVSIASRKMRYTVTTRDPNFPDIPTIENTGFYTMVQDILREKDKAKIEQFREVAVVKNPLVYGSFVSKDMKGTVILCDFWSEEKYKEIFRGLQDLIAKYKDDNTTFQLGGRPIMLGYFNLYLGKMIGMFGVAIVVMLILLFLSFRSPRGMIIPVIAGFLTVIWTLGIIGTLKIRVDMLSLTVPFLIFAVAISHSVQVIKRFYERFAATGVRELAAEQALATIALPAVSGIITDVAGYFSIMIFPFRIVRAMGFFAGLGMFTLIFTSIIFVALLLSFLPNPTIREVSREEKAGVLEKTLARVAAISFQPRSRYVIIAVTLVFLVIGSVGATKVQVGDTTPGDPFFWANSRYNRDELVLNRDFLGTNPVYVLFDTKQRFGIHSLKVATYVNEFSERLRKLEEVRYVSSYVDLLKGLNFYWWEMDPKKFCLPVSDTEIGLYLYSYIQSVEPEVTRPYFNVDEQWGNIQIIIKDHQVSTIDKVMKFIKHDVEAYGKPQIGDICTIHVAGGLIADLAAIIETLQKVTPWNMIQITIFIFFWVALTFRSLVAGLLVLIPLAIGKAVTFGFMGFGNIGYFLYAVPAIAPGMGIGVDYSIYVLERLKRELKEHPDDHATAYAVALSTTGKAVIFTAMSVALGVLVLLFSQLRFQALMGSILACVIICNMIAALVLLPALVSMVKPRFLYGKGEDAKKQ